MKKKKKSLPSTKETIETPPKVKEVIKETLQKGLGEKMTIKK